MNNQKDRKLNSFILTKKENKDFRILQLTDIQVMDVKKLPYKDRLTKEQIELWSDKDKCVFNLIKQLIKETKPDYIVTTGDNVYGQFDLDGNCFISFVQLMDSFQIPWSYSNGNHDGETFIYKDNEKIFAGKGMKWQGEYVKNNSKYCLYELGDEKMGYGNYFVTLMENNKPFFSFTFLDTHGCVGEENYGINNNQICFYENEIKTINKNADKIIPNFLFIHTPLIQFQKTLFSFSDNKDKFVFSQKGTTDAFGNFGETNETVCNAIDNDIFWNKLKNLSSTIAIFFGHDHVNNASVLNETIRLTYGTKTGTFDYHNKALQGGTLITIKKDASFSIKHILK